MTTGQNIFTLNAKVTGSGAVVVPIAYRFDVAPIKLPLNRLMLHIDNSSWRMTPSGYGYRDDSAMSAIDTEVQLVVTYRVGP